MKFVKFALFTVAVVVVMLVGNIALRLLGMADDFAVAGGLALLALLAIVVGASAGNIQRRSLERLKKIGWLVVAFAALIMSTACGTTIQPGHAGIIVDSYGKDRGVQSYTATTGRVWYNPLTTNVFQYPTFVQSVVFTHSADEGQALNEEITFTNADQMSVAADVSLSYSLDVAKLPQFYVKFRSDDLNQFTYGYLRSLMRDKFNEKAGHYTIAQIMGDNGPFLKDVKDALQADLEPIGVKLESQFGFIGAPRPPQQVIAAINMKVQATQLAIQKQNELVQVQADAAKQVAQAEGAAKSAVAEARGEAEAERIKADADAYYNQKLASTLSALFVENRRIDKWDGHLPQVSGGATPFINLQK